MKKAIMLFTTVIVNGGSGLGKDLWKGGRE